MKRNFFKAAAPVAALAVGATSLVAAMGQPSQAAFPNKVFGCNVPGANAQPGGAPNALIASPNNVFNGYPVQMTIGVFKDVTPAGGGVVTTGAHRCLAAMLNLNELAINSNMINSVGVTYEVTKDARGNVTAATVCLVPSAAVGTQACPNPKGVSVDGIANEPAPVLGESYHLFTVEGPDTAWAARMASELLGSLSVYTNPGFPTQQVLL